MNMQVSSLERTNSLLVTATPAGLMLVENVLTSIDVPPPGSGQPGTGQPWANDSTSVLRVYKVASADEGEVAKTLDALIPGVVVNEDRRQDTIHVFATPKQHEDVAQLISTLDKSEGDDRIVEVIKLRHANPIATAALLSGMFKNDDRDERPMIQPELPSRTIVVRGTAAQVAQVRAALVGLVSQPNQRLQTPIASKESPSVGAVRKRSPMRQKRSCLVTSSLAVRFASLYLDKRVHSRRHNATWRFKTASTSSMST